MSEELDDNKYKYLYLNRPQLMSQLVNANKEYHVLGRGTGKTSGILARKSLDNIIAMPRLSGCNIGNSYSQQLTRTLPSLIAGWELRGYRRDVHYIIGKRPDAKLRWPTPYEPPVNYDYYFSWFNGSGMHLGSQDVAGSTIGMNIQWLQGDEAKKLNKQKLDEETRPAMRGYRHLFGELSQYRSECYTTSMPMKATEKWILEEREKMDPELVTLIIQFQLKINDVLKKMLSSTSIGTRKAYQYEIRKLESAVNELRKNCVFYQEASSLENIAILGEDYFHDLYRTLPPIIFNTEILNLRNASIDGCFYPAFNIEKHTYSPSSNIGYLESLNYDLEAINNINCKQDGDLISDERLRIAIDWGGHMNYMSIAQKVGMSYRFINELWVKHPEHIDHLAIKFAKYYAPHRNKEVILLKDHTGDNIKDNSSETSVEQFIRKVKEIDKSWSFQRTYRDTPPSHDIKYKMCYAALKGAAGHPRISINEDKCEFMIVSISNAPIKEGPRGIEKDKSSERKPNTIDPLHATHASDTFDMHINAEFADLINGNGDYIGF